MNAVEIEAAISDLALEPFDAAEFPFTFLAFEASKQTQWMQQNAEQSLADTRPNVTHAQAMASAQAVIDAKRNKHASDDLADLVGYIADDNPDAAQELKDEIESKAAKLPEHPRLYKLSPRVKGTFGYRVLACP